MLKVFFASHGPLAEGMAESLHIISGKCSNLTVFSAYMDETDLKTRIDAFYESVSEEDEVLLCSDIYGGSVNQIMYLYLNKPNTRLVTGVNLGFFLSVMNETSLKKGILERIIEENRKYLCEVKEDRTECSADTDDFFGEGGTEK